MNIKLTIRLLDNDISAVVSTHNFDNINVAPNTYGKYEHRNGGINTVLKVMYII